MGAVKGLRGPVGHCEIGQMHDNQQPADRPLAAYLVYPMPCETKGCEGRLICAGHAVCPGCAAAIRADLTMWTETGNDVDVLMVHSALPRQAAS